MQWETSIAYSRTLAHDPQRGSSHFDATKFCKWLVGRHPPSNPAIPGFSHNSMHQNPTHWGLSRKLCASEMNHHPSFLSVLEDHASSSSSSSDSSTGGEQYQSHSFHPINQGPPVWANTERPAIPPSPIHTTSSFDRFANSPLPVRNPFGGGETLSNPADAFTFDGYHGTEREDNKLDTAASPGPPSSFACGFAFHQFQPFEDHPPVEPHNSFVSQYMAYRFEPQYLPSTWHAMYKPSETDRKPPASSFTPNRPAISPLKHPGAPAFLSSSPMVPPFSPAVRAPANVPQVASRDPEAYSASNTSPRTEAAGSSPTSLASNRPHPTRRSKKVRGGRRQPVPPQHQGNHAHEMPTKKELDGAATNRAKNAIHSWYQRYNELVDYANKFGDSK